MTRNRPVTGDQVEQLINLMHGLDTRLDDIFWELRRINEFLDETDH